MKFLWGAVACAGVLLSLSCARPRVAFIRFEPDSVAPNKQAQSVNDAAYRLIGEKKWAQALPVARKAAGLAPEWGEAHKNLAIALLHTNRLDEALSHAQTATRLSPGFAKAHDVLGQVQTRRGEPRLALKSLQEALRLNPKYARAFYDAGMAYHEMYQNVALSEQTLRDMEASEQMFAQAVTLEPDEPEYHLEWANALATVYRRTEAEREFRTVIAQRPQEERAYNGLLIVLELAGRHTEYDALARRALRQVKPESAVMLYHVGHALAEHGRGRRDAEAMRYFQRCLKINPNVGAAYDGIAVIHGRRRQYTASLAASRKAIQLAPRYELSYVHMGYTLYLTGKRAEGRAAWRRAAALAQENGDESIAKQTAGYLQRYPE